MNIAQYDSFFYMNETNIVSVFLSRSMKQITTIIPLLSSNNLLNDNHYYWRFKRIKKQTL